MIKQLILLVLLCGCLKPPEYNNTTEANETWRFSKNTASVQEYDWSLFSKDPVLEELINQALTENQEIHIAFARICQYYNQYVIARSFLFPEINATASPLKFENSLATIPPYGTILPRTIDNFSIFLNVIYELDLWGKISNRTQAALDQWLAQDYTYYDIVLTIVADVSRSYVRLRQLDAQLLVSEETASSRKEYMEIAKLRYEEGLTSELPSIQASTEWESAVIEVKRLEREIAQEENLLSLLIGSPPNNIPRGLALDKLEFPDEIPVGLPSELLLRRPDILSKEQKLEAAGFDVAAARADFFPKIDLTGFFGYESAHLKNFISNEAKTWSIAANIFQPIFNAGRISAQVQYQEAILAESYYSYVQTTLNAFREVEDALIAHQKDKELLSLQTSQVKEFKEYLRLATLQYENGETDYLNVLDAQRKLFEAQLAEQQASADVYFSMIDLYRALGGGWECM